MRQPQNYDCFNETIAYSADSLYLDATDMLDSSTATELLNTQEMTGVPPYEMRLVRGALHELMRNLNAAERLMNHTKVITQEAHAHHVVVQMLQGKSYPSPRICFKWSLGKGTTSMTRRQYPSRPACASAYNGAQGETMIRCIVDVRKTCFAHGHLYVSLGRVAHRDHLRCLALPEMCSTNGHALAKNIVWNELLLSEGRDHVATNTLSMRKRPAAILAAGKPKSRRRI